MAKPLDTTKAPGGASAKTAPTLERQGGWTLGLCWTVGADDARSSSSFTPAPTPMAALSEATASGETWGSTGTSCRGARTVHQGRFRAPDMLTRVPCMSSVATVWAGSESRESSQGKSQVTGNSQTTPRACRSMPKVKLWRIARFATRTYGPRSSSIMVLSVGTGHLPAVFSSNFANHCSHCLCYAAAKLQNVISINNEPIIILLAIIAYFP